MARKSSKTTSFKELNGAVKQDTAASTPNTAPKSVDTQRAATVAPTSRVTHGAYTPTEPNAVYRNAQELLHRGAGRNIGYGTIGSFESRGAYRAYLDSLTTADLHRHAIDEAHIVAIDDRDRLIKRLEQEWLGVRAKEAAMPTKHIPARPGFTVEQRQAQEAIRAKLLKGHQN